VYDDRFHAYEDPRLADVGRWREFLTDGYFPAGADNLWRPLVSLSYAVQWRVAPGVAWPFHLVNVLLHAAASALAAELARRLTGRAGVAWVAGSLFAAHPVHVEAVAYIVGRAESACAVGALGALVLFVRPLTVTRALAVFACFAAAALSKEQGLLVPALLWGVWRWRRAAGAVGAGEARAARVLFVLTLFALAGYAAYRDRILPWHWEPGLLDDATQPMVHSGARDRALIPFALLGRAVALIAAPVRLSPEYGLAVITSRQSWGDPYLYVGLAGAAAAVAAAWAAWAAYRRGARTALLLLFAAGLTYGMVANVVLIGVVFAERLLYLPSAFVLILAAVGIARLPRRWAVAVAVVLTAGWGLRAVTYAARWNDRLGFYEVSVRENPRAARLRVLLARELIDRGRLAEARAVVDEGLRVSPEYGRMWRAAAQVAIEEGRLDDAAAALDRAWRNRAPISEVLALEDQVKKRRAAAATRPGG
jgi:hypothetical protein